MTNRSRILIIDDDPLHLKLHSWILQQKGFETIGLVVKGPSADLPKGESFDLVLLDYRFKTGATAPEIAQQVYEIWPSMPIVVLSDMMWMPDDMANLAKSFVRKGDPEQLVATITELVENRERPSANS